MKYEVIDDKDATYKRACENVKKIVDAIKGFNIKYYLDLTKMPENDAKAYEELQLQLNKISAENGLDNLKIALVAEIEAKYDNKSFDDDNEKPKTDNDILLACYGAIDAEEKALSSGKISQAIRCQEILNKYKKQIASMEHGQQLLGMILKYKREKMGELNRNADKVKEANSAWKDKIKGFLRPADVESRNKIAKEIARLSQQREKDQSENSQEMILE